VKRDEDIEGEHHFTTYGNSPTPLLQALYIGQPTRRLKVGTAAVILPVWQPLRLAEEIAVLDNLIDGRFLPTHLSVWPPPPITPEQVKRSLQILPHEVMPAFK
jgi:hypothetical protein